jgi:4-amino-4-deoxy-L-arabinose transferase-like glycosyltransferase
VSLTLAWIGWRLWGGAVGLTAGFIAVTTHGVFTLARVPMPDMTLCFLLTAAMAVFVAAEFDDRRPLMLFFYLNDDVPTSRRRRVLVLAWTGVTFLLVAVAREQRMRYYLPLCPPAALLIAAWAHHLPVRHRVALGAALAVLVVGGSMGWQVIDDRRHNARTDLRALGPETVPRAVALHAARVPELGRRLSSWWTRRIPTPRSSLGAGPPR